MAASTGRLLGRAGGLVALGSSLGLTVAACADDNKYFDPDALERGAKALREIQNSPFAKRVSAGCSCRRCCCMHVVAWGTNDVNCMALGASNPSMMTTAAAAAAAASGRRLLHADKNIHLMTVIAGV